MVDKSRLHAGVVALLVTSLWAALAMVAVYFAEPPPGRRAIIRAAIEKLLAMAAATATAVISAPWAADLANGLIEHLPLKLAIKVDPLTACAVVAVVTVVLIADPTARQKIVGWLRAKIPGAS